MDTTKTTGRTMNLNGKSYHVPAGYCLLDVGGKAMLVYTGKEVR